MNSLAGQHKRTVNYAALVACFFIGISAFTLPAEARHRVEILAFAIGSITILTSTCGTDGGVGCGIIAIINIAKDKT